MKLYLDPGLPYNPPILAGRGRKKKYGGIRTPYAVIDAEEIIRAHEQAQIEQARQLLNNILPQIITNRAGTNTPIGRGKKRKYYKGGIDPNILALLNSGPLSGLKDLTGNLIKDNKPLIKSIGMELLKTL